MNVERLPIFPNTELVNHRLLKLEIEIIKILGIDYIQGIFVANSFLVRRSILFIWTAEKKSPSVNNIAEISSSELQNELRWLHRAAQEMHEDFIVSRNLKRLNSLLQDLIKIRLELDIIKEEDLFRRLGLVAIYLINLV